MTAELLVLTNIPTPYRIAFFNRLEGALVHRGAKLRVMYCAQTEPGRLWNIDLEAQEYDWEILSGIHPRFPGIVPHINPGVVPALLKAKPNWLICAGAWNTPTIILAREVQKTRSGPSLFWSETHGASVRNASGPVAYMRRRAFDCYDGFIVPNARSREFVESQTKSTPKIIEVPNTVDTRIFRPPSPTERRRAREKLGFRREEVVFSSVCALTPGKGIVEASEALIALSKSTDHSVSLVVAGVGPLESRLREISQLSGGTLRLLGYLEAESVRDLLHASDAFILASRLDANPLAMVEAASCGLPLLAPRTVGNSGELIIDGGNGFTFDEPDVESVRYAASRFLAVSPDGRKSMRELSQSIAEQRFDGSAAAEHLVEELERRWPTSAD